MLRNKHVHDRLYLSQEEEDTIYIDNCNLPQHHIEGIRFLYRQFKRKTNGVIINDPYSFGRNIQIILFLKAVRSLLHRPILILCQEGTEDDWVDRFYTWTDMFDDVVVEATNPFIKKLVVINTMVNLHLFCAREWSIIIVDGDKVTSLDPILKLPFKSDFKIWNSPKNMKENLDMFGVIYEWMFPHEIFDKYYFIADPENAVDVIEKSILLDSFLEDVVIRRDDLNSSFEKFQKTSDVFMPPPKGTTITVVPPAFTAAATPTATATAATCTATVAPITVTPVSVAPVVPIVTKKNKDATGTKIKRSKVRIDTETITKPPELPAAAITKLIEKTSRPYEPLDNTEDFSIENYKKRCYEDKGDKPTDEASSYEIIEIDNMSNRGEPGAQASTAVHKLEEMDTLVFGHDTLISKVTDRYKFDKQHTTDLDKKDTEPHTILTCKPIGERYINRQGTSTDYKRRSSSDSSRKSHEGSRSSDSERDKKNDRKSLLTNESSTIEIEKGCSKMNIDELNKGIRHLDTRDDSEKYPKRQKISDAREAGQSVQYNYGVTVNTNELNEQTSDSGTQVTEQGANRLKRNNVDDKKKECEEKLSKKFKGSFLDRLF